MEGAYTITICDILELALRKQKGRSRACYQFNIPGKHRHCNVVCRGDTGYMVTLLGHATRRGIRGKEKYTKYELKQIPKG